MTLLFPNFVTTYRYYIQYLFKNILSGAKTNVGLELTIDFPDPKSAFEVDWTDVKRVQAG